MLETYPPTVVEYISSPYTGIQRKLKFPPALAEVVEACDDRLEHEQNIARLAALPKAHIKPQDRPEPSEEEKERVKAGFAKLLGGVRENNVVSAPQPQPKFSGPHAARVAADLAARRARTAEQPP